jgi:multiple sugar transport system permease protein
MQRSESPRRARAKDSSTLSLRLWEFAGIALLNLFIWLTLVVYLSPLSYMLITSLKTSAQMRDSHAPILPARVKTFNYNGRDLQIFNVPTPTGVQKWALEEPHVQYSLFVDPVRPQDGLIRWNGYWGGLRLVYVPSVSLENFVTIWQSVGYPNLLHNTLIVIGLGEIGVLCSSIMVAYGFARFHFPGGKFLFFLMIGTIMIPDSITLVPTFVVFGRILKWAGTFYPLIVPQFFGSAIYIFLLRQNFKTIPRDLDEAAMLDGAGPLRTLVSVILSQSIPTVVTVALLHFFNAWNELKVASLYLGVRPDLQTMAFSTQITQSVGSTTEGLQARALLLIVIPLVVLFLSQCFFMEDMVLANVEK